jgi:hypothetical protein
MTSEKMGEWRKAQGISFTATIVETGSTDESEDNGA